MHFTCMKLKNDLMLISFFSFSIFLIQIKAQIPNGSFEDWEQNGPHAKPKAWTTNQSAEFARIHQDTHAVKGKYSIKFTADTYSAWVDCSSRISTIFPRNGFIGEENGIVFFIKSIPNPYRQNKNVYVSVSVGGIKNGNYTFVEYWRTFEPIDSFTKIKISLPNLEVDSIEIRVAAGANNDALDGCSFPSTTWIDGINFEKPLVCQPAFHPNPSPGFIEVQPLAIKTNAYYLYSVDGRLVESGPLESGILEFQNHFQGIYLLRFGCENGMESEFRKIVIFK